MFDHLIDPDVDEILNHKHAVSYLAARRGIKQEDFWDKNITYFQKQQSFIGKMTQLNSRGWGGHFVSVAYEPISTNITALIRF